MRIKKGFVIREVCGEQVIMGEGLGAIDFGKLITLNETACFIWQEAKAMGDFTIDALAERLCSAYDVSADEAHADVSSLIGEWQSLGIIE